MNKKDLEFIIQTIYKIFGGARLTLSQDGALQVQYEVKYQVKREKGIKDVFLNGTEPFCHKHCVALAKYVFTILGLLTEENKELLNRYENMLNV